MVRFEYLEPTSLGEAIAILDRHGSQVKVLAGGTDLLALLKERTLKPRFVVNIKGLNEMAGINHIPGKGVRIGALTTIHTLETSSLLKEKFSALAEAAHLLGSPQVRNLATIGGNLCNAAPSAETAPSLLSFSASVRIAGPKGERTLPLGSFFSGPGRTVLQEEELLAEIFLPEPMPRMGSVYLKHCPRGSMDIPVVGVAVMVALSSADGRVEECRIGLGAVGPTPVRATEAEELLRGRKAPELLVEEAAQRAAKEGRPSLPWPPWTRRPRKKPWN
ncbi:MAG: xanthine dehydrogenase family protein subunit M [Thermodesulfobacteriota bacterium]